MQVQESGPSCIYVALAGPKSAAGYFPQSEEQPIWDQLHYENKFTKLV